MFLLGSTFLTAFPILAKNTDELRLIGNRKRWELYNKLVHVSFTKNPRGIQRLLRRHLEGSPTPSLLKDGAHGADALSSVSHKKEGATNMRSTDLHNTSTKVDGKTTPSDIDEIITKKAENIKSLKEPKSVYYDYCLSC